MGELETKIASIIEGKLVQLGYEIYDISFKGGKSPTLSIVIDRKERISLEDIVAVSEAISPLLDEDDPIESSYTLDISSAGAEKRIEVARLSDYIGSYVNLHLTHPYEGENILEGTLLKLEDGLATLQVKKKNRKIEISFPSAHIDRARLAISF